MKSVSKQEGELIYYFNQKNKPCFTTLEATKVYPSLSESSIGMYDKHYIIEEPYELKGSRTVLKSSSEGRPSLLR